MMRGLKMLALGVAVALPAGFVAGIATTFLVTSERTVNLRRNVARKIFGVEPGVDFETLQQ
jgi:hypothetical protein